MNNQMYEDIRVISHYKNIHKFKQIKEMNFKVHRQSSCNHRIHGKQRNKARREKEREEETWAEKRKRQASPIKECKLQKLFIMPTLPLNFAQMPKTPNPSAAPCIAKCIDFLAPLDHLRIHRCAKIAVLASYNNINTS